MNYEKPIPTAIRIKVVDGSTDLEAYFNSDYPGHIDIELDDGDVCMGATLTKTDAEDLVKLLRYFIAHGCLPINQQALDIFEKGSL